MYFKPKIFISSTFELIDIREKIKNIYEESGAEVILYEKDLTPSIKIATYREDIKDADFVIFIFNEKYGKQTGSGKSGTHEEWDIVKETKIPKHVYLKESKKLQKKQKDFINKELKKEYISYYYYKNNNILLEQIKRMTFTIARDIAINKINDHIEEKIIKRLAIDNDYEKALDFIKEIDLIKNLERLGLASLTFTSIILEIIGGWDMYFIDNNYDIFIDQKMNDHFHRVYQAFSKFKDEQYYCCVEKSRKVVFYPQRNFVQDTMILELLKPEREKILEDLLMKFLDVCKKFEEYIFNKKNNFEKRLPHTYY